MFGKSLLVLLTLGTVESVPLTHDTPGYLASAHLIAGDPSSSEHKKCESTMTAVSAMLVGFGDSLDFVCATAASKFSTASPALPEGCTLDVAAIGAADTCQGVLDAVGDACAHCAAMVNQIPVLQMAGPAQ